MKRISGEPEWTHGWEKKVERQVLKGVDVGGGARFGSGRQL